MWTNPLMLKFKIFTGHARPENTGSESEVITWHELLPCSSFSRMQRGGTDSPTGRVLLLIALLAGAAPS